MHVAGIVAEINMKIVSQSGADLTKAWQLSNCLALGGNVM